MTTSSLIEISALRIFSVVAHSETLTQAATQLGVTQSAVSQALKQIERQLGVQVVMRRSRPVKLTPAGVVLFEHAERVLADTRKVLNDVRMVSSSSLPRLNLGMIDSFGDMAALYLVEQADHLTARLQLRSGLVSELSRALVSGDLDIIITSDPLNDHPEFGCFPILRDPFVMLMPRKEGNGTTNADKELDPIKLVRTLPFIRYSRSSRIGVFIDLIGRRLGLDLESNLELDSTQTLMRFVAAGKGWAITSAMCLIRYPELLSKMDVMPLANSGNARSLCLLHRHRELGDVPRELAQICRSVFDENVVPDIVRHAPWLKGHVHSITDMPVI